MRNPVKPGRKPVTRTLHSPSLLKLNSEFLSGIIDNIPDTIFVKDDQGRYLINNKAHLRQLGRKNREEVIGKTVYELFPRKYARQFDQDDKETLRSGESLLNREELMVDKSGHQHWMSTSKIPIKDARGKVLRLVGISRDITEIKLYQEALKKANDRMEGELAAARKVQKSLIPSENPDIPGIRLHGFYEPATEVGGDYLDYFPTRDGRWVLVIADVCGKGVAAALLMAMLRSAFRGEAAAATGAKDLLGRVNLVLRPNLSQASFITALCLVVDSDGRRMSYARAGHPPLIRIRQAELPKTMSCRGAALGLFDSPGDFSSNLDEMVVEMKPGDRYFLFTDGLIETLNRKKACYGMERLSRLLARGFQKGPEQVIRQVVADALQFRHGAPVSDDLALLAFEVLP